MKLFYNEPLSKHSTFRIGGPADVLAIPETIDEMTNLIEEKKAKGERFFVLGNGSNILFADEGFRGTIIKTTDLKTIEQRGEVVSVSCGVQLPFLARSMSLEGLSGLEFAAGIPATIGGAIRMNAGAHGSEMSDIVRRATILTQNNDISIETEHGFGYRTSKYKNTIILQASLELFPAPSDVIQDKMQQFLETRRNSQPGMPSAGSAFKRPSNAPPAAKLIDDCGLKGKAIGGAQVSLKHAGFIVNTGNATASDVLNLMELIKDEVEKQTGVKLEEEIIVVC